MKSGRIPFLGGKSGKTLLGVVLAASTGCAMGPDPRTPDRIATIQDAAIQLWIETPKALEWARPWPFLHNTSSPAGMAGRPRKS